MRVLAFALILMVSLSSFASKRLWFDATLTNITSESRDGVLAMPLGRNVAQLPITSTTMYYHFETDAMEYVLLVRQIPLNLTVNKPAKLSMNGSFCYVIDDAGKQRNLRVVSKLAKSSK